MIPDDILQRYHIGSAESYAAFEGSLQGGKIAFYHTFLMHTDYIPNKIIEAQALGVPIDQDYTEILQARAFARAQLSMLDEMKE